MHRKVARTRGLYSRLQEMRLYLLSHGGPLNLVNPARLQPLQSSPKSSTAAVVGGIFCSGYYWPEVRGQRYAIARRNFTCNVPHQTKVYSIHDDSLHIHIHASTCQLYYHVGVTNDTCQKIRSSRGKVRSKSDGGFTVLY